MDVVAYLATAMGIAWASGINLYATVAVLGVLGATGHMELPAELTVLTNEAVIGVAIFMYLVEFFADKIPGVDLGWDTIHTFIRIPAGAILAANQVGELSQEIQIIAFLLGGMVAASSHTVKMTGRIVVNTSPEPFSNWLTSIGEDLAALGALWLAFSHPYVMLGILVTFFVFAMWITPKLFSTIKLVLNKLSKMFSN